MSRGKAIRRRVSRVLRAGAALFLVFAGVTLAMAWKGLGHRAEGERLARMQRSPQWKDGHFENPEPLANDFAGMLTGMMHASEDTSPKVPIDVPNLDPARFRTPPDSGLRITWFGHSTTLIEVDGVRVLTDPVWSERVSPLSWVGPTRWYPVPIALADLPKIDAVMISHDHYDHLDRGTIERIKDWDTTFVVPLGIGAHLEYWGVPASKIQELDWWEETKVGGLRVVCTPARHASGRHVFDKDAKLWASWTLLGAGHRVFFSGDTGLFPAMKDIGDKFGPFDVTMIETGQYHSSWPDWHIGPEQAVGASHVLRGKLYFPMHWGALALAYHGWTEPIERALVASAGTDAPTSTVTPRPGQSVEPDASGTADRTRWWPDVPWQDASVMPIVSTRIPPEMAALMPYGARRAKLPGAEGHSR
ncbi:MAG: MBL fold metallo-hydrolase [Polyangiaceae bacterium]